MPPGDKGFLRLWRPKSELAPICPQHLAQDARIQYIGQDLEIEGTKCLFRQAMRLESGRYCTPPTIIAAPPTIIAAPPEFGGAWASRQRRVIAEIIMIGMRQVKRPKAVSWRYINLNYVKVRH